MEKLFFDFTPQIERYLNQIIKLDKEFLLQDKERKCIINNFEAGEEMTQYNESNREEFFGHLQDAEAIDMVSPTGGFIEIENPSVEGIITIPIKTEFKVIDIEKIKQLLSSLQKSKKIITKKGKVKFLDAQKVIQLGDKKCRLIGKNEYRFCVVVFSKEHPVGEAIYWDDLYNEMMDDFEENRENPNKKWRVVYDTCRNLNKKVKKHFHLEEDIFSWINNSIIRNY